MSSYLLGGAVSLSAIILGIRYYNSRYVWGRYEMMLWDNTWTQDDTLRSPDSGPRTYIVTGANSGIGKETVRELFRHGARVILACRNESETRRIIAQLYAEMPQSGGELIFRHLDLASFESVRKFVSEIEQTESQIHSLINNAAIFGGGSDAGGSSVTTTVDGFELNTQVNHLSSALLTILLLPKLRDSPRFIDSRGFMHPNQVIMVTSTLYKSGKIHDQLFDCPIDSTKIAELCAAKAMIPRAIYASTKLANLLFTRHLASKTNRLVIDGKSTVIISLASPGFTLTRLHRYMTKGPKRILLYALCAPLFAMILKSARQGAQTVIGCAMSENMGHQHDVMYQNCRANQQIMNDGIANNITESEHVYRLTMRALKLQHWDPMFDENVKQN